MKVLKLLYCFKSIDNFTINNDIINCYKVVGIEIYNDFLYIIYNS